MLLKYALYVRLAIGLLIDRDDPSRIISDIPVDSNPRSEYVQNTL